MNSVRRGVAAVETVLIFPATLFMTALFVRNLQPQQFEPARTAQRIVMWYAARPEIGLWLLLIALPMAVLLTGSLTLLRAWRSEEGLREAARRVLASLRPHAATVLTAVATLLAGGILAIVALHLATD